jgi:CheY-like chemotaxis protein
MEGYTVETACDGEEAIAKADSYQPHLVLLDLMIPRKAVLKFAVTFVTSTPKPISSCSPPRQKKQARWQASKWEQTTT